MADESRDRLAALMAKTTWNDIELSEVMRLVRQRHLFLNRRCCCCGTVAGQPEAPRG